MSKLHYMNGILGQPIKGCSCGFECATSEEWSEHFRSAMSTKSEQTKPSTSQALEIVSERVARIRQLAFSALRSTGVANIAGATDALGQIIGLIDGNSPTEPTIVNLEPKPAVLNGGKPYAQTDANPPTRVPVEVTCSCGMTFWMDALNPSLPDGPFTCSLCSKVPIAKATDRLLVDDLSEEVHKTQTRPFTSRAGRSADHFKPELARKIAADFNEGSSVQLQLDAAADLLDYIHETLTSLDVLIEPHVVAQTILMRQTMVAISDGINELRGAIKRGKP